MGDGLPCAEGGLVEHDGGALLGAALRALEAAAIGGLRCVW
jgi:hypothetical protein